MEIVNKDVIVDSFSELFYKKLKDEEFNLYRVSFRVNYQRKMIDHLRRGFLSGDRICAPKLG